ncbi:MAG: SSS family solute:Na+ symporter [Cryomorphaceae bacterium]|jgi:SSS family solute:Na+ symporter
MSSTTLQVGIFIGITALIAVLTYIKCRAAIKSQDHSVQGENKEVFLAGGSLTWVFVAGSITLTNLSTDQLVGMNGNQMLLVAWWEFAAVIGLIVLAKVFLPVYYKYKCTTTTELLEKRYGDHHIRAVISVLFLLGNIGIFIPAMLYGGSLFMKTMFGLDVAIITLAISFALAGAAYAVFGGLRAVAVSDAYSGVLLLSLGMAVVFLSLNAINWDLSGIPAERLTLIGDSASAIPWHTLLTGMLFIQIFYWSTNQTITQRAMASPTIEEGQKGVYAAAIIRLLIVPAMIVIPGIVSYKLYGHLGDAAYGRIVGDVLPVWLSGAFAAAVAAAVLTSVNSILNASTALYVCDIHEKYSSSPPNVKKLNAIITLTIVAIALILVPFYERADSIIETVQQLYGLLSMPILSAFLVCLVFDDVDSRAAILAVIFGVALYAILFFNAPIHYIHSMFVTLVCCVIASLTLSRFVFKTKPTFIGRGAAA